MMQVVSMQDRVSLLPQVPVEVAYFWKDPSINRDSLDKLVDEPCALCEVSSNMHVIISSLTTQLLY